MGGRDRQGAAEAARLRLRRFPRRPDRYVEPARSGGYPAGALRGAAACGRAHARARGGARDRLRGARHAHARAGRRRRRLRAARARRAGGEVCAAAEEPGQRPGRRGGCAMSVRVYDLAHARAGDKGNTSNISVICYDAKHWEFLERELTPERVAQAFKHIAKGPIRRHPLRNLKAFNFVIENALGGGVTVSLAQDIHGKSLSNVMLAIELPDPK